MKTTDIKNMAAAIQQVAESQKAALAKKLAKASAASEKGKAAVTLPKAPFDIPKKKMGEKVTTAAGQEVDKPIQHDCATHVEHAEWGEGNPISGQHTIVETTEGHGYVTHYDVMFEHGVEKNVAVEDLTILAEMSHGHSKKKKNEEVQEMSSKEKMKRGLYNSKMDPVGQEDDDVDNDGDVDKSDKYLKNRRKAISKNIKKGKNEDEVKVNPKMGSKDKADDQMESRWPILARIMEKMSHTAGATKPETAKDKFKGKGAQDAAADLKMDNPEMGGDEGASAKTNVDAVAKSTKKSPMRPGDNAKGDTSIVPSATPVKS